jgi:hypothetical protein
MKSRLLSILVLAMVLSAGSTLVSGETEPPGYVFSVTVQNKQQLDVVLDRAEDLRELFNPDEHGKIAIVLHGDELQLFLTLST